MDWGRDGWRGVLGLVEEAGGVGRGFRWVGMLFCLVPFFTKYTTMWICGYEKTTVELMNWGGPFIICGWLMV